MSAVKCFIALKPCLLEFLPHVFFLLLLEIKKMVMSHSVCTIGVWAGCAGLTGRLVIRLTAVCLRFTGLAFSIILIYLTVSCHMQTCSMKTRVGKTCFNQFGPACDIHTHRQRHMQTNSKSYSFWGKETPTILNSHIYQYLVENM